jgi:hypothetical protein
MNWKTSKPVLPLAVAVLAATTGCVDRPQAPSDAVPMPAALGAANVQITNDAAVLESRITREARPLQVLGGTDAGPIAGQLDATKPMSLTLVGTVQPPVVDGQVVMANDIDIHDYTATIAYNFAGDPFAGAVQVIDFQKARPSGGRVGSRVPRRRRQCRGVAR